MWLGFGLPVYSRCRQVEGLAGFAAFGKITRRLRDVPLTFNDSGNVDPLHHSPYRYL